MQSSGDGSWELAAPHLAPPDSTFIVPGSAYIEAGATCIQAGGGGPAGSDGGSFLDLAHVGIFGSMDSNADNSMFNNIESKPCVQPSAQTYKQGGEDCRHLSSAATPRQPPRWASQQNYNIPTSRQLSRSVPSSPTFATSRLHMIIGGGGSASGAPTGQGRGNRLPIIAKKLSAHMNSNQQLSSSASVLTASLDLASCTSNYNLLPPSPGSIRSGNFSSDTAAAARTSNFSSDHEAKISTFSNDQVAAARPTNFTSDHAARSATFGSDHASAARPSNFSGDHTSRSPSFSNELAAAASLFLPFFPTTPAATSTASLNLTSAAEQDHHLSQAPAASCSTNNLGAKKRRLQGIKSSSKLVGADVLRATQDDVLQLNIQGGGNVEMGPTEEPEMSNNSANNEGEESAMKGNGSITSSKTQDCEAGPPPPPKQDYIHVRARRGQATDSHSLAERVRREKISERMKFLQDLVPGCNKITGKAVMLDEIINYVQSLQRQVEFLSMKLSTVSPQISKFEASDLINHGESKSIQTSTTLHFNQINDHHRLHHDLHLSMPLLLDVQQQAPQHPSNMGATQAWEDELQSLVQMGFPTLP